MWKLAFLLIVFLASFYVTCSYQQELNNYKNEEYNADFRSLYSITQQSPHYNKFKCTEPGLYANVNHCRIYYKCVRAGHKHRLRQSIHKCKVGTVFSYALNGICTSPAKSERLECGGNPQSTDNHSLVAEQTTVLNDFSVENEKEITSQAEGDTNLKDKQREEYKSDKLKMLISNSSKNNRKSKRHESNMYESGKSNGSKNENHQSNDETEVTTHFLLTEEQIKEKQENMVTISKISYEEKEEHEDGESDVTSSDLSTMGQTEGERNAEPEITTLKVPREEEERQDEVEVTTLYILTEGQTEREEGTEPDITAPEVHLEEEKRHEGNKPEVTTLYIPEEQTESKISTELEITTSQMSNKESEEDESNVVNTTKMEIATEISTNKIESSIDDSNQDKKNSTTQVPNVPNTSNNNKINLKCISAGFFPEPSDCTKYYRCVQFGTILKKYKFVCPKGTIWDQDIMTCNFANVKNLSCKKKIEDLSDLSQEKHEITDNYKESITIDFSISTKLPAMSTVSTEIIYPVENPTEDQTPFICPTGFRRHPKYCNLFYQCIATNNTDVKIVVFKCSEGTIFIDKKIRCVREAKVRGYDNCKRFNSLLPDISVANLNVPAIKLCPGEGRYPYNKNCSNIYYNCKRDSHGILQGYLFNCPNGEIYSNILRRCKHAKYFPMCKLRPL